MGRRKPRAARSGGNENYLASVSDLMAGILFIFVILLMWFAFQFLQQRQDLKLKEEQLTQRAAIRSKALHKIAESLKDRGIQVQVDDQNGILRLPESVLFDQGHAVFNKGGLSAIAIVASELKEAFAQSLPLEAVLIEGHTDDAPIVGLIADSAGTYRDNWDLSFQRAKQTYLAIIRDEPSLAAIKNERQEALLGMGAYSDLRPVASNATAIGQRANRRIDIRMLIEAEIKDGEESLR